MALPCRFSRWDVGPFHGSCYYGGTGLASLLEIVLILIQSGRIQRVDCKTPD
jgi:hypothetical protein